MGKNTLYETRNAFWGKLGEQLTVPVLKSPRILGRRPKGTEVITGRALQLSKKQNSAEMVSAMTSIRARYLP